MGTKTQPLRSLPGLLVGILAISTWIPAHGNGLARLAALLNSRAGRFVLMETEEGARIARLLLGRELRGAGEAPLLAASALKKRTFGPQLEERLAGMIDDYDRVAAEAAAPRSLRSRYGLSLAEESLLRRLARARLQLEPGATTTSHRFFRPVSPLSAVQEAHGELLAAASASRHGHAPLMDSLLKTPAGTPASDALSDIARLEDVIPDPSRIGRAPWQPSRSERLAIVAEYPLDRLVAAPGHRFLNRNGAIQTLREHIRSTHGGQFAHQPVVLNLIVDDGGRVLSVDIWDAHHRLVAYLEEGYRRIGDLPAGNVRLLVNGTTETGEAWAHYVPAAGIELESLREIRAVTGSAAGTLSVSGRISNFALGSRTTLGQLQRNIRRAGKPKVGVFIGTFDPVHEGHMRVIQNAKRELGLDEIVIVPNGITPHKPDATGIQDRIAMLAARVGPERGFNLYTGDSSQIVSRFGDDPLFQRIGQLFGTSEMVQIVGEDAFRSMLRAGWISQARPQRFFVLPRGSAEVGVPSDVAGIVRVSRTPDELQLSSTKVRSLIAEGKAPPASWLHPRVLEYIRARGLYR